MIWSQHFSYYKYIYIIRFHSKEFLICDFTTLAFNTERKKRISLAMNI